TLSARRGPYQDLPRKACRPASPLLRLARAPCPASTHLAPPPSRPRPAPHARDRPIHAVRSSLPSAVALRRRRRSWCFSWSSGLSPAPGCGCTQDASEKTSSPSVDHRAERSAAHRGADVDHDLPDGPPIGDEAEGCHHLVEGELLADVRPHPPRRQQLHELGLVPVELLGRVRREGEELKP